MSKLRVLHVTTVPTSLMFLDGQSKFMRKHGITLFALSSPGEELDAWAEREEVGVFGVPMARQITPWSDLIGLARIVRTIREVRPDIVHAHTPKGGLLGTLGALISGVPTRIYHMRGLPLTTATGMRRALLHTTEWIACRAATDVFCVSHSLRKQAIEERLADPHRIEVLAGGSGNGVDALGRFNPEKFTSAARNARRATVGVEADALVFGFVGRLVRDKGIRELVEAWSQVRAELPSTARLMVVGPYEERDPVPPDVKAKLESDPSIVRVDFTRDTPELYAAMDVVVLPTYREGFPNVPLEAAAMGLPVIATQIPGCVDAVDDGTTGILVPPGDAGELAQAMKLYARSPSLRSQHGRAGRARVLHQFSRRAVHEALLARYFELTARSREKPQLDPRLATCAE